MTTDTVTFLWPYAVCAMLLFIAGLYCLLASLNLVRALIGAELLLKGVTVIIIAAGYVTGRTALCQALVITFIVIEVVVMTVALGLVVGIQGHNKTLDVRELKEVQ